MSYFPRPGSLKQVVTGATGTVQVQLPHATFGRDLLILHRISGSPTLGGRCAVQLSPHADCAIQIPHHGDAVGLPGSNVTTSYSAIVRDVSEFTVLDLIVGDGTHDVWVQSLG